MAIFDVAIPVLLEIEGNGAITNDANDPGKTTKWGITQMSYPQYDIPNLTREQAIAIYRRDWWLPAYDQINAQRVATKLFCFAVNMGAAHAHMCIQNAIRAATPFETDIDGDIGDESIKLINLCDPAVLLGALKSEGAGHYRLRNELKAEPDLKGLLNRAYG